VLVNVDRDSVAMGDDAVSHRGTVEVPNGVSLAELLRLAPPEIARPGWTWVCRWNGRPFAVWSCDRGVQVWDERYRTVDDLPDRPGQVPELFHSYWLQMDADWLVERLRAGATLDRRALEELWRPVAAQRYDEALRDRERTHPGRLLDAATTATLEGLGARVDVHTDTVCRFFVGDELWTARRHDTMTILTTPRGTRGSLRPVGVAQLWIVALVARTLTGREAFAAPLVDSAVRASPGMWTVTRQVGDGQELAQQRSPEDLEWFRRVVGRSVQDVAAAYGVVPERQERS
jgi:hypothetical protein